MEKKYNYFKKSPNKKAKKRGKVVKYGAFSFVCDNHNQADLLTKWLNAGDNFKVKG